MKLLFWRKPKWVTTPVQTFTVPPGKHTVNYTITSDGKNFNTSTVVFPTVTKVKQAGGDK